MIKFLKIIFLIFNLVFFFNLSLAFDGNSFSKQNPKNLAIKEDISFQNKRLPISNEVLKEIKKSQILLLIVVTFFVCGFLFLIYHLKKIRIINQQLEIFAKENEFLISETNHRVNNNLQLISLLISDTLRKTKGEENRTDFMRLLSKVETIASLHRHLYLTKNNDKIDLKNYLFEVKNNFSDIAKEKNININFVLDSINIIPDNAMYFGLLVSELIINSVKHAFDNMQEKSIHLFIEIDEQNSEIEFEYYDNGELSKGEKINPVLVIQLCQQLSVSPEINSLYGFNLKFTKKIEM